MFSDLLGAALSEVDYHEIAEAYLSDAKEEAHSLTSQGAGIAPQVHGARPWNGQTASQRDWSAEA